MCVKPRSIKNLSVPYICLNDKTLVFVEKYKYLGVIFSEHQSDNDNINRQTQSIFSRGNMLIKRLKKSVMMKSKDNFLKVTVPVFIVLTYGIVNTF